MVKRTKKTAVVDQDWFDSVKKLTSAGMTTAQASKITGLGYSTVHTIKKFDTLEAYRSYNQNRWSKNGSGPSVFQPPSLPLETGQGVPAPRGDERVIEVLEKLMYKQMYTNRLLERIARAADSEKKPFWFGRNR